MISLAAVSPILSVLAFYGASYLAVSVLSLAFLPHTMPKRYETANHAIANQKNTRCYVGFSNGSALLLADRRMLYRWMQMANRS